MMVDLAGLAFLALMVYMELMDPKVKLARRVNLVCLDMMVYKDVQDEMAFLVIHVCIFDIGI